MENKTFLGGYRISLDLNGAPVELRRSGTGVTYKAEDVALHREVALELIPCASLKLAVRQQLEAEAHIAQQLSHINIPRLYAFGFEAGQLIYVTESFDGTTLEDWVRDHGPMPNGDALRIVQQVIGALGATSFHRIVHHAINPKNIVIVPGQTGEGDWPFVKVLHFVGVAPTPAPSENFNAGADNAARFASPEQLQTGVVDFRSEIYSVGCVLWFLLTGTPPLVGPRDPQGAIDLTSEELSGVPKAVRRLLAQMMAANPDERPRDPIALFLEIRDCLSRVDRREAMARKFGVPVSAPPAAMESKPRRPLPMKALAMAALILTLATLAALILPERLRQIRFHRAQARSEPIGIPIGVPESGAAVASVIAQETPASESQQLTSIDGLKDGEFAEFAVPNDSNDFPTAAPSPVVASTDQAGAASPPADSSRNDNQTALTSATAATDFHEVRRAEPAPQDELDPAPPAEGPKEATRDVRTTAEHGNSIVPSKAKRLARVERTSVLGKRFRVARASSAFDGPLPPSPHGTVRARFVGTTPDGQWVLMLPSARRAVVVPPPSDPGFP